MTAHPLDDLKPQRDPGTLLLWGPRRELSPGPRPPSKARPASVHVATQSDSFLKAQPLCSIPAFPQVELNTPPRLLNDGFISVTA